MLKFSTALVQWVAAPSCASPPHVGTMTSFTVKRYGQARHDKPTSKLAPTRQALGLHTHPYSQLPQAAQLAGAPDGLGARLPQPLTSSEHALWTMPPIAWQKDQEKFNTPRKARPSAPLSWPVSRVHALSPQAAQPTPNYLSHHPSHLP